jgi:hypothetical protein
MSSNAKKKSVPKSNRSSNWKRGVRERIAAQQKEAGKKKSGKREEAQAKLMPWERAPVTCPYCKRHAMLVTGKFIYPHRPDLYELNFWLCDPCNAYVGTHKAGLGWGKGTRPKGTLADAPTRNARKAAHAAFDPIWMEGDMSRGKAYAWLAQSLGLSVEETHIGVFNVETCQRVITLAKALRAEQAESCLV